MANKAYTSRSPHHVGRRERSWVGGLPTWRKALIVLLLSIGATFMFVGTLYASSVARMATEVKVVLNSVETMANTALGCGSNVSLNEAANDLVKSTNALNDELNGPQWDFVRDHSKYGNDIDAAREMLASVETLVNGPFTDMVNLSTRLSGFSMKDGSVDVSALMDMPEIFTEAHADLREQLTKLESIATPSITQIANMLNMEKTALNAVDTMLGEYDDLVSLLPQLLGEKGKRTYLVLVQNSAELRSAGGMVGTVAAITADKGVVTIGDFQTTADYELPSEPMDDLIETERQVFGETFDMYAQTTTIDPEYQRVALMNKYLWQMQKGNEKANVAGVLALDPVFLQSLLGATGSVTLSDGKVLDSTSTVSFLLHDLYVEHNDFADQNKYVSEAAKEIMSHVLGNTNGSTVSALLKAIRETSANGHLKLWMADETEQQALVDTGVLDDMVSGELSADNATPAAGVYLSELQMGKQDWYLRSDITVTKTCGDVLASQNALNSGSLDSSISSLVRDTQLGQYPESSLGDEYTVVLKLRNSMTKKEAHSLPTFITSADTSEVAGGMLYRVVLTAPYGGEITAVQADAGSWRTNTATLYDRQYIVFDMLWIEPEGETTIAFTVRVNAEAVQPLNVVTTPLVNADGIQTGSNGQVVDECPTQSKDAQQDEGTQSDKGSQQSKDAQSDKGGKDDSAADPSAGLDSLDRLRSQMSCPVDLGTVATSI